MNAGTAIGLPGGEVNYRQYHETLRVQGPKKIGLHGPNTIDTIVFGP